MTEWWWQETKQTFEILTLSLLANNGKTFSVPVSRTMQRKYMGCILQYPEMVQAEFSSLKMFQFMYFAWKLHPMNSRCGTEPLFPSSCSFEWVVGCFMSWMLIYEPHLSLLALLHCSCITSSLHLRLHKISIVQRWSEPQLREAVIFLIFFFV